MNTDIFHPVVVHFPIALIIVGFFIEVISLFFRSEKCLSKAGFYLMIFGTLGAIVGWATGQFFTDGPTQGEILKIYNSHKTAALVTMIIMITGTTFRTWLVLKKKEETDLKWIAFACYLLACVSVSYTGLLGGKMVYEFMIGLG
jgi:uncharacterized membrane protein